MTQNPGVRVDQVARPGYEDNFYAWAIDQAARLRAQATRRGNEAIDWQLLAEEVGDLGKAECHACESHVEQVIVHLLKYAFAASPADLDHWADEITGFRLGLARQMTRTIENHLRATMADRYRYTLKLNARDMAKRDSAFAARLPAACPFSFEQIVGADDWLPQRP